MDVQYPFLPLSLHSDYGFGATADAFKESADALSEAQGHQSILNGHLALAYLYRHALELYLKSMIVLLHRRLRIPFGAQSPDGEPCVVVNGTSKPFHRVHSVKVLFDYYEQLVKQHAERLDELCTTDWSAFPNEVAEWIGIVESSDPRSTFFRYPNPQSREGDHDKSSFQASTPEELIAKAGGERQDPRFGEVCVLITDHDDNVINTYRLNRDVMPELLKALRGLCDLFEGGHFGMRIELANGT